MVRWEPGARGRLQAAALELFATRGFEQVTAAEIAQSVGLTERTFFRHFSDKREVLCYGQQQFLQAFVDGVNAAPPDASPLEVIACALHGAASFFPDERRPYSRAPGNGAESVLSPSRLTGYLPAETARQGASAR